MFCKKNLLNIVICVIFTSFIDYTRSYALEEAFSIVESNSVDYQSQEQNSLEYKWNSLYELYNEIIKLEESNFSNKVFSLANDEEQIEKGISNKIVLKDQDGEKWIFKLFFPYADYNTLACYKVSKILGLKIPETHVSSFTINGKQIEGLMIRFIDKTVIFEGMEDYISYKFSDNAISDILKKEVFDYLVANRDVTRSNLLFRKVGNIINSVYGIDMNCLFGDIDPIVQSVEKYCESCKRHTGEYFYSDFYKMLGVEKIKVSFKKNFAFINLLNLCPDNIIKNIMSESLSDEFVEIILERKKRLLDVFLKYYRNLKVIDLTEEIEILSDMDNRSISLLDKYILSMEESLKQKRAANLGLKRANGIKQKELNVVMSWEAWEDIVYFQKMELSNQVYEKLLDKLNDRYSKVENEDEKEAIKEYIEMLEDMQKLRDGSIVGIRPIVRNPDKKRNYGVFDIFKRILK